MENDTQDSKSSPKSFFQTLPGIITGIAAIITALGGFVLALNQTGCFGARTTNKVVETEKPNAKTGNSRQENGNVPTSNNKPYSQEKNSSTYSKVDYSTTPVNYLGKEVSFTIKEAAIQTLPDNQIFLQVKIKCVNESGNTFNWGYPGIRVKVGEDKFPPEDSSPTYLESIYAHSFKLLTFNFKLPSNGDNYSILFYDHYNGNEIGSIAFKFM